MAIEILEIFKKFATAWVGFMFGKMWFCIKTNARAFFCSH